MKPDTLHTIATAAAHCENSTVIGCYGDGVFGHDHTRQRCADVVEYYVEENFTSRGLVVPNAANDTDPLSLVAFLRVDMSDDASEEYDACDWLNEHAPFTGAFWGWHDGDFGLWMEDSDDD